MSYNLLTICLWPCHTYASMPRPQNLLTLHIDDTLSTPCSYLAATDKALFRSILTLLKRRGYLTTQSQGVQVHNRAGASLLSADEHAEDEIKFLAFILLSISPGCNVSADVGELEPNWSQKRAYGHESGGFRKVRWLLCFSLSCVASSLSSIIWSALDPVCVFSLHPPPPTGCFYDHSPVERKLHTCTLTKEVNISVTHLL